MFLIFSAHFLHFFVFSIFPFFHFSMSVIWVWGFGPTFNIFQNFETLKKSVFFFFFFHLFDH